MKVSIDKSPIKISIVVPVYNEEKYLERSITSLRNQKYSNIQIILVNDGSTDHSLEILNHYKELDNRILVIDKINGGLVDATLEGIKHADGEYTCFLDPDDFLGNDFILNFINLININENLDFYATGFYQDDNGTHTPYVLKKNSIFNYNDILKLKSNFLYDRESLISNSIFISRWNKIYRTTMLKKIAKVFCNYKEVNLGEDTIFTFIMLTTCRNGMASTLINSYYYNVGNQDSMMKAMNFDTHFQKALIAYNSFKELLNKNGEKEEQAYILYFDLISAVVSRVSTNEGLSIRTFKVLKKDEVYRKSINIILNSNLPIKTKIKILFWKLSFSAKLYFNLEKNGRRIYKGMKNLIKLGLILLKNFIKYGFVRGYRNYKFTVNRRNAFEDIRKNLPLIEERITPFLKKYKGLSTDLHNSKIEKNIFIFWWDGLDKAPEIVKICIQSVKQKYPDYNVLVIDQDNYKKYTKINKKIIQDFERGKISIQTFSDILRFNLLYNNGGVWTDATIFYRKKYDLLEGLKNKSFESICFNTSNDFLEYKGKKCSWSGFLIASRKHGLFVEVMNNIFEQYYLKYNTYSIYFFIDAAFMICKLYEIDDKVLDKIQISNENMFDLIKVINCEYYEQEFIDNTQIPQKLSWFANVDKMSKYKTNYDHMKEVLN